MASVTNARSISIMSAVAKVVMYTTQFCPYCHAAKRLLKSLNVAFKDIAVDGNAALRQELVQKSGQRTVPQIWIGETHVGGSDELHQLHRAGKLDELLNL